MYPCNVCGKLLSCPTAMYRHRKNVHKDYRATTDKGHGSKRCGMCDSTFSNMSSLCSHLCTLHDENAAIETKEFENEQNFVTWKNTVAAKGKFDWTVCWKKDGNEGNICNRSGKFETKTNPKRAPRHVPTIKLNFDCSCFMTVNRDDTGCVKVTYCLHHYGHQKDATLLHISKQTEGTVAAMVHDKRDADYILSHIQGEDEELTREDLFSKADIRNIVNRLELDQSKRAEDDTKSVELWIEEEAKENGENSPFFYYRHEGTEFSLGIGTIKMLEMLKRYGDRLSAMDSTHNTTIYNLKLVTLMVLDNRDKGYPVAWLLTNSETTIEMKKFLRKLKAKVGDIQTKCFMSDCAVQFWDGWRENFNVEQTSRLWCTWHVRKNWRENIRSKLNDKTKIRIVSAMLAELMKKPIDEGEFYEQAARVKTKLDEWNEKELIKYLDDYYLKDSVIPLWAYFVRHHLPVNTNTLLESFHKVLKAFVMKGKVNKRTDRLIQLLLECAKMYETDYARDCISRRIGNNNRWDQMHDRHRKSFKIVGKCEMELVINGKEWRVESETEKDKLYNVCKIGKKCDCIVVCRYTNCNVCRCSYTCTCYDFLSNHACCKHIHLIYQSFLNESAIPESEPISTPEPEESSIAVPNSNINILKRKRPNDDVNRSDGRNKISELSTLLEKVEDPQIYSQALQKIGRISNFLMANRTTDRSKHFEIDQSRGPIRSGQNLECQKRFERRKDTRAKHSQHSTYAEDAKAATKATADIDLGDIRYCTSCLKDDDEEINELIGWIGCTKCNKWFHSSIKCAGNVDCEETFVCKYCV